MSFQPHPLSPSRNLTTSYFRPLFEENKPQQTEQKAKAPRLILILLPAILAATILYISHHIGWVTKDKTSLEESAGRVLDRVFQNLETKPITDITIGGADANCPGQYEILHPGTFQGIKRGCLCDDGSIAPWHKCLTTTRCRYISAEDDKKLTYWGTSSNKYSFCVKRSSTVELKKRCENQQVQCASDICIPTNDRCPLNTVECKTALNQFTQPEQTANINFYDIGTNQKCLDSFDAANKLTLRPIVHFEISTADGSICLDPELADITSATSSVHPTATQSVPRTSNYPLQVQQNVGCNRFGKVYTSGTPVFVSDLDVNNAENPVGNIGLMTINNVWSTLTDVYKYTSYVPYDYNVYLNVVHRFEIGDGPGCDKFNHKDFREVSSRLKWTVLTLKWISYINFALCILTLVLGTLVILSHFALPSDNESSNNTKIQITKFYVTLSLVVAFLALLSVGFYYIALKGLLESSIDKTDQYRQNNCLPQPTGINDAIKISNDYARAFITDLKKFEISQLVIGLIYAIAWGVVWKVWANKVKNDGQNLQNSQELKDVKSNFNSIRNL